MLKSKKVIVSGATGFIGQHLIPILLKDGYEVLLFLETEKKLSLYHGSRMLSLSLTIFIVTKK